MRIDATDYNEDNPFLRSLQIRETTRLRKLSDTDKKLFDTTNKKVIEDSKVVYAEEISLDKANYVKIFRNQNHEENLPFEKLNKAALDLLKYIIAEVIEYNNDKIILDVDKVLETKIVSSKGSYYSAINNLVTNNVIAKHKATGVFWINPNHLYFGERRHLIIHKK